MITYHHAVTSSGAETLADQLANTPVGKAGPNGKVRAAFVSTLMTNTAKLVGRQSGKIIIPEGSHSVVTGALTALNLDSRHYVYAGTVDPFEELDLQIVVAAAGTIIVGIMVEEAG